ncbi:glycosyltransferase [Solirubrobacter soli]|uniref:glycosyltransferase n=1 Tax=Solirubrobacter soli TaxID=363832 RepID=UPI00040B057F|nr:glycosyltransferase [Solirubrobacter soli]
MRICIVYDCLFPYTVGGGERWYRNVAQRLAADGHDVTYLTLRQWPKGERGEVPGVRVIAVGPRMALYGANGNRRIQPPLVFGLGVLWHLLRHGRRYDVVHTSSFPYFSLLAAAALRPLHRYRIVVDWFELWSREYWSEYLGGIGGKVGRAVQNLCLRVRQHAFCFAELTARRLREDGLRGEVTVLRGMFSGPETPPAPVPATDVVVFAGRHIPEKRAPAVVRAVAQVPDLHGLILGDGPDYEEVKAEIARLDVGDRVEAPGFVETARVEQELARALCLVLPSRREGYGLVVVEAASLGTPSVLVRDPDNAATELIEEGVNGFVADAVEDLPEAIERVRSAGPELRASTADWYGRNASRLSLAGSLDTVAESYASVRS